MQPENIDEKIRLYQRKILQLKILIILIRIIGYLPIVCLILAFTFRSFSWILYFSTLLIIFINWKLEAKRESLQHKKYICELTSIAYRIENGEKFKEGTKEKEKFNQLGKILRKD